MGSAASTERAERRRRERTPGHSGASSSTAEPMVSPPEDPSAAADVRRKGCKVAPEPKEGGESLPGSPSFRIYCQQADHVDALVAATATDDDHAYGDHGDGFATTTDRTLAIRKNDLPHCSGELPKSKEGWLKFKGQAIVETLYGLVVCRSKTASAPNPHHHPHAKPPRPCAALPAAVAEPYL